MNAASLASLRREVLRSVSRSFYLSIRILPPQLRDPIALAYLLARATDTIADTAQIAASVRLQHLRALAGLLQGGAAAELAIAIRDSFAPLQTDPSERALIQALPECVAWLGATDAADRVDIRRVLALITKGQTLDVERFGSADGIVALQTAVELDEYTYLVAGCVGEFWTTVSFRHVPQFADRTPDEMLSLGVRYGKALQLINILRDLGADLRARRCYLPAEQLQSAGVRPDEITARPAGITPLLAFWQNSADEGLRAGIEYACAIRPWRVRLATVLPALIGARTLALLRAAGAEAVTNRIKVNRREVRRILLTTASSFASPAALRRAFERYRK